MPHRFASAEASDLQLECSPRIGFPENGWTGETLKLHHADLGVKKPVNFAEIFGWYMEKYYGVPISLPSCPDAVFQDSQYAP